MHLNPQRQCSFKQKTLFSYGKHVRSITNNVIPKEIHTPVSSSGAKALWVVEIVCEGASSNGLPLLLSVSLARLLQDATPQALPELITWMGKSCLEHKQPNHHSVLVYAPQWTC
ncbi:hypothetical protein TRVL_09868 [Trypanosoma vivax]|nr:hypothetical protein TRVL_09868 [Trypanosoma vivax]